MFLEFCKSLPWIFHIEMFLIKEMWEEDYNEMCALCIIFPPGGLLTFERFPEHASTILNSFQYRFTLVEKSINLRSIKAFPFVLMLNGTASILIPIIIELKCCVKRDYSPYFQCGFEQILNFHPFFSILTYGIYKMYVPVPSDFLAKHSVSS
jgi:hypothetical protein